MVGRLGCKVSFFCSNVDHGPKCILNKYYLFILLNKNALAHGKLIHDQKLLPHRQETPEVSKYEEFFHIDKLI